MRVLNCKPKILNKKNSNVRFRKINIHSHKIYNRHIKGQKQWHSFEHLRQFQVTRTVKNKDY